MTEPLVIDVPLRWGDMDAQGHVNNAGVAEYLQEARVDFLLLGENAHLLGGGIVVVGHEVVYKRPIVFSAEPVRVSIAPCQVGASRFVVGYELHHRGELCAVARTTLCPFDFAAGRPRRLTAEERSWFAGRLVPGPEMPQLSAPALRGRGLPTDLRVRWSDVDSYGHVNNVRYFDFIQEARIRATTALDPTTMRAGTPGATADSLWLVARQDVDYVAQIEHRVRPYRVLVAPVRVGTSSVTLTSEIVDPDAEQVVLARGRTVLVHADGAGRPAPLTDATRAALEAALVA